MEVKPVKRRRFRYSLRGIMLLILILCVGLGIWVEKARKQRLAVAAITGSGGVAYYDYEFIKDVPQRSRQPSEPRWLLRISGIDFFHNVRYVVVTREFEGISKEKIISPTKPLIPVLSKLADLPGLRRLYLGGGISDAEICRLKDLKSLEELYVDQIYGLSDEGAQSLSSLKKLKSLSLVAGMTDKGLSRLSELRELEKLQIACSDDFAAYKPITEEGLKYLGGMTKLREFWVNSEAIGDGALSHLEGLVTLETLGLYYSHVTDAGLRRLAKFPHLKSLSLEGDELITEEEMKRFETARPDVKVNW